jgi:hypothetical protein
MDKQAMREEAERLMREAMARKGVTVKQGDTRDHGDVRQMRRAEQGFRPEGDVTGQVYL